MTLKSSLFALLVMVQPALALPFSDAVQVGPTLYLSGQIGIDYSTGHVVTGGIIPETTRAMENIGAVLKKYHSSFDNVVKCTVMLGDIKDWDAMNSVYVSYFSSSHLPARSAFATNGLALGAKVEIECLATVNTQGIN